MVVEVVRVGVRFDVYVVRCGNMGVSGSLADSGEETVGDAVSFVFESVVDTVSCEGFGSFGDRAPGSGLRDLEKNDILDSGWMCAITTPVD